MSHILNELIKDFEAREQKGLETYNTTLDRKDLTLLDWMKHLREELMDASLYLKKLEYEITKNVEQDGQ
jgi:hypothetical protein